MTMNMNILDRFLRPDCHRVRQVLQAYSTGNCPSRTCVELHLESCDRCGIEAGLSKQVKQSLAELRADPDPGAMARLRHFVDALPPSTADGDNPGAGD